MKILTDWSFWRLIISCVNLVGIILLFLFNKYSHDKITTNDLVHLAQDVKEIKETVKKNSTDIAYIKGKLSREIDDE